MPDGFQKDKPRGSFIRLFDGLFIFKPENPEDNLHQELNKM